MNPWGKGGRPLTEVQLDIMRAWTLAPVQETVAVLRDRLAEAGLDLRKDRLHALLTRLRKSGRIPPKRFKGTPTPMLSVPGAARRVGALSGHLPPHIATWLERQVPPGSDIMDTLAAIVTDAYHDEREGK